MVKVIAIIGESGSGKDRIQKELIKAYPDFFNEIVSCTTRPKREGEIDGINYHFITLEDFQNKVANQEILEFTQFREWWYGTPKNALRADKVNIGVFNPTGAYALTLHDDLDVTIYRLYVNPKERLLRQLMREENPDVDEIVRRYQTDKADFWDLDQDFSFKTIYNETPEQLCATVEMIYNEAIAAQDKCD